MTQQTMPIVAAPAKRRVALAAGLFFLAPLVAEFLLGNLPIKLLPALIVLAPMYGGAAVLVREFVRRAGRGWPSIVLLGIAYGIFEEAFTTQSLFNPNYLHLNLHLLDPAYITALGIGAWWTLFVLNLHAAWSISTSIALMEALRPEAANSPWLGRTGLLVTGVLFVAGSVANTLIGYRQDHFLSSTAQLISAAIVCLGLIFLAFRLPSQRRTAEGFVPAPWVAGVLTLLAGSAFLLIPKEWGWGAVAAIAGLDLLVAALVWLWSRSARWNIGHTLALAGGAALAYGWHAFLQTPAVGQPGISVRIGNATFAAGAIALIATAAARIRRSAWRPD